MLYKNGLFYIQIREFNNSSYIKHFFSCGSRHIKIATKPYLRLCLLVLITSIALFILTSQSSNLPPFEINNVIWPTPVLVRCGELKKS
jgi:hypothetical protein